MRVEPGETITVDTISHEGLLEDQGRDPRMFFARHGVEGVAVLDDMQALAESSTAHDFDEDGPHVVTGPIAVRGARPGDLLAITVLKLTPPRAVRHGLGAARIRRATRRDAGAARAVITFATAHLDTDGPWGRIALAPARGAAVRRTDDYLVPIGLDEDLDEAMRDCVRCALDLLATDYGIERHIAMAYLSAAADFAVSQVVDLVKGVHGKIRKADFREVIPP